MNSKGWVSFWTMSILSFTLTQAIPARADIDCSLGYPLHGGTYTASTNFYTSSDRCFIIDGAGLNMNNYTITCRAAACGPAVVAFDGAYSTVTVQKAILVGNFGAVPYAGNYSTLGNAIDMTGVIQNVPVVYANTIPPEAGAIASGGKVYGNIIHGSATCNGCAQFALFYSASNAISAAYQYIQDNIIDTLNGGIFIEGAYTGSGSGPKITTNVIRAGAGGLGGPVAIVAQSSKFNFVKNIFMTPDFNVVPLAASPIGNTWSSTTFTTSGNVCVGFDPTQVGCEGTKTPFVMP